MFVVFGYFVGSDYMKKLNIYKHFPIFDFIILVASRRGHT